MATSRLALVAALAIGVDAARIARKRARDCYSMYDGKTLLTLNACSSVEETLAQLKEADCYILDPPRVEQLGCTDAEVVCTDKGNLLEKAGIAKIISSDAGAFWRSSSGVTKAFKAKASGVVSEDFYSEWRDLDSINARVQAVVSTSTHATLEVAGKSLQGRDMYIVRIRGRGYTPEKKMPRVFLTFNLHAREWITGMAGVYAVEHLVKKAEEDWSYFDGTEVVLMPMANPDGFLHSTTNNRMHRKNMANNSICWGVDLNRNFDTHWASGGSSGFQCMDTFHGPSAMSEPETQVIDKVMKEAYMTVYVDTHSFTQLVLTSPGWTKSRSVRHNEFRAIGGSIQQAMQARHGATFTEGPTATTLYVATGTTMDYATEKFGSLGICLELRPPRFPPGGGFNPPVSEILPSAEETFDGILAAIDFAKNPSSPPEPPTTTAAPSPPWLFR